MSTDDLRTSVTADGLKSASWRFRDRRPWIVRIELVDHTMEHAASDHGVTRTMIEFNNRTDLVDAREQYPQHEDLWDAVMHALWEVLLTAAEMHSQ